MSIKAWKERIKIGVLFLFCFGLSAAYAGISVSVDRSLTNEVKITFPELKTFQSTIDGKKAFAFGMEGTSLGIEKGIPEVPFISGFLMIPNDRDPQVKVTDRQFSEIDIDGIVRPSKGSILRTVDPETVPYEFNKGIYENDAWYPSDSDLLRVGKPFIFRDIRGVRISVPAVQYNPVQGKLRIYSSITAQLQNAGAGTNVKKGSSRITKAFEPMYQRFFLNFKAMGARLPRLNENGRLVIIAADELYDATMPLVVWRKKCGVDVKIVRASEIGGASTTAIVGFLKAEYTGKGFTHVILVGDAQQIPTLKGKNERADSDPCYVKLEGDDNVPDAIISRISATNANEVAYQVAKFVNYEQFPSTGADADWYLKAMGIASSEGDPTDFQRMGELRDALLKARYTSMDEIYDTKHSNEGVPGTNVGGGSWAPYDWPTGGTGFGGGNPHLPPMMDFSIARADATETEKLGSLKDMIFKGVNEGRGLIHYIGHGSKDRWVTSSFNTQDCLKLNNGWKLPLIISVACVNGDFARGSDCFCEAWMKAGDIENPRGAVGIYGASTNMAWVPPCVVQAEISTNLLINETYKTAGGLMMNGIMKGLEQYGTEDSSDGVQMLEQWHWFGDCTTMVRTRKPAKIDVKAESAAAEDVRQVTVMVLGEDGKPVADAVVTAYSEKMENVATARSNAEGRALVNLTVPGETKGYITVVGPNLVPIVDLPVNF